MLSISGFSDSKYCLRSHSILNIGLKGLAGNPGIGRLASTGKIILTELKGDWAKRTRSEIYLSTMFWETLAADNVFLFGHGGVRCLNSPLNRKQARALSALS